MLLLLLQRMRLIGGPLSLGFAPIATKEGSNDQEDAPSILPAETSCSDMCVALQQASASCWSVVFWALSEGRRQVGGAMGCGSSPVCRPLHAAKAAVNSQRYSEPRR